MPRLNGVKRLQVTNLQKNKNDYPQLSKLSKITILTIWTNAKELHNMNKLLCQKSKDRLLSSYKVKQCDYLSKWIKGATIWDCKTERKYL